MMAGCCSHLSKLDLAESFLSTSDPHDLVADNVWKLERQFRMNAWTDSRSM